MVGAIAIVLAAMYMLRLISAVLHQSKCSAVPDTARDLRLAELGLLVPLVAVYQALLTAYLVKIVVTGVWPGGLIGWIAADGGFPPLHLLERVHHY